MLAFLGCFGGPQQAGGRGEPGHGGFKAEAGNQGGRHGGQEDAAQGQARGSDGEGHGAAGGEPARHQGGRGHQGRHGSKKVHRMRQSLYKSAQVRVCCFLQNQCNGLILPLIVSFDL